MATGGGPQVITVRVPAGPPRPPLLPGAALAAACEALQAMFERGVRESAVPLQAAIRAACAALWKTGE
jgi:hypothetical protein